LAGKKTLIHGNKSCTKSGSRFYIHGRNVGEALLFLLQEGEVGEKYNIVGEQEISNEDLFLRIRQLVCANGFTNLAEWEIVDFHSSRPGHDLRYALDGSYLEQCGFTYEHNLNAMLEKTVKWYLDNQEWLG